MYSKPHFKIELSLLRQSEGGRSTAPQSGYRPQIEIEEDLTSCVIVSDSVEYFELGGRYEAYLTLLFPENYKNNFKENDRFSLREGNRIVGEISILEKL